MTSMVENAVETAPDSDDEDENEDGQDFSDTSSVSSEAGSSTSSSKKKKKKKKKKPKSGGAEENSTKTAETAGTSISSKEADKRLNAAIDAATKADEMWLDLSGSSIQQARVQKLLDALKTNESVTSINLSGNLLDDAACSSIAVGLGPKGANGLLDLDLRDNPLITEVGLNVLEGLRKMRKKVLIKTGVSKPPDEPELSSSSRITTPKGKLFKKFFRSPDDDDESIERQDSLMDDRGVKPHDLWAGIKESRRGMSIPQLTSRLEVLKSLLEAEISNLSSQYSPMSNPLGGTNRLGATEPHLKECAHQYEELRACLITEPKRVPVQFTSRPIPSVGTHRVAVAAILSLLLSSRVAALAASLAKSKLVPLVIHLALTHPLCSTLHAKVIKVFECCLSSPSSLDLLSPMMSGSGGWGSELRDPTLLLTVPTTEGLGGDLALMSCHGGMEGTLCPPLPEILAAAGMAMMGRPSGQRSPAGGLIVHLSRRLKEEVSRQSEVPQPSISSSSITSQPDRDSVNQITVSQSKGGGGGGKGSSKQIESIPKALASFESWRRFSLDPDPWGEDDAQASSLSSLSQLIKEQDDDLCGPKPIRPPPPPEGEGVDDDEEGMGELAELAGGGLMSGRDILALLQGMRNL